jgi:hypothetical protein
MALRRLPCLLLVVLPMAMAYIDSGRRNVTLWPPVAHATQGEATALLDPCSFQLVDTTQGPSDVPKAIALYRPWILPSCTTPATGATLTRLLISAVEPLIGPGGACCSRTGCLPR